MQKDTTGEIKFLEDYYKFYSKKNGNNMGAFVAIATKTLVQTNQITSESLEFFQKNYYLKNSLEAKQKEIEALKKECENLKKQISQSPYIDKDYDPCGKGSFRTQC